MKLLPVATTSLPFAFRLVALVVMSVGLTAATGCAPAVVGCPRGVKWAHPTMAVTDMTSPADAHIRSITEGAAGGSGDTRTACGCN